MTTRKVKTYWVLFNDDRVVSCLKGNDLRRIAKHIARKEQIQAVKFWKKYE